MPHPTGDEDFLRMQVLTSRNVRGGPVIDVALGGLKYPIEHHFSRHADAEPAPGSAPSSRPTVPRSAWPHHRRSVGLRSRGLTDADILTVTAFIALRLAFATVNDA
jgi:hypothetical protein